MTFEPNPPTLKRLLTNIDANRCEAESWPNLKFLEIGVADENTICTLAVNEDDPGASSIAESNDAGPEKV